jgi:hypothetical protein
MAKAVRRVKDNPDLLTEVEQMADTDIVLQNVKSVELEKLKDDIIADKRRKTLQE